MTDRDVLDRAAEALRKTGEPSDDELARLRERVLANNVRPLHAKRVTRNVRWLLPLAAAFMAATALAATPGAWEGMLEAAERFLNVELLAPGRQAAKKPRVKASAAPVTLEPSAQLPEESEPGVPSPDDAAKVGKSDAPQTVRSVDPSASHTPTRRPGGGAAREAAKATVAEPSKDEPVKVADQKQPSADLTLYKTAHEIHFRQRIYAQALVAWDAYLLQMPSGTFAIEAKYNRALCLIRLGRYVEARAALSEFAEGKMAGGYRREEAARFIEALDKRP